jgi:NADH-quinone oxidoreductase subunit M
MVLGAYYLLQMLQRVLFGPLREPGDHAEAGAHGHGHATAHEPAPVSPPAIRPVGWHEIAGLAPLMVLIVAIGVYPRPIFERIGPPVRAIVERMQTPSPRAIRFRERGPADLRDAALPGLMMPPRMRPEPTTSERP